MIKGIDVILYERTQSGVDEFNKKTYTETAVTVKNVLVMPMSATDIVNTESLYGKKATYQLCLPKGDSHTWEDCKVEFFGQEWHVFGPAEEYIENNIPLAWNKKVMVEQYG